jgi:SAM-dependent methyltransferase
VSGQLRYVERVPPTEETSFVREPATGAPPSPDFLDVTEIADRPISREQLDRLVSRYGWAAEQCRGKDALEVACGTGPGLGLLASAARSFEAGDLSAPLLDIARRHYGTRVALRQLDAQALPLPAASKDVIILFEALYYLPQPERFVAECARVLRSGGKLLIATANKDLWDFHPSPFSHRYFGVPELRALCEAHGFDCRFFGFQPVEGTPLRQRLLRPIKRAAVASGLMPKTMKGKRWLKRIVFGAEVRMPAELTAASGTYQPPAAISADGADRRHKIIYCAATRRAQDGKC